MKTFLIIFLLSLNLFAQEGIINGRGGARYLYTAHTGTHQIVNEDLYLYGSPTIARNDTGGLYRLDYLVYNYENGTPDSVTPSILFLGYPVGIVQNPIEDTTLTYCHSLKYKTKK